jgi:DNA polymerase (family 10)
VAEHLGISRVSDLITAGETHRLRTVPGIGPHLEERLLRAARDVAARSRRLPLYVAWPMADAMAALLLRHGAIARAEPVGSIRRRRETVGDIDILVGTEDATAAFDHAARLPIVREVLWRGPAKCSVLTYDRLQIDLWAVEPGRWGAALQVFTGSKAHNVHLRTLASARGLKLNEYGVFRTRDGERLGGENEADVYAALDMPWIPPELREDHGEIEAAQSGNLPDLVHQDQIRGDCHTHTTWSDGQDSLAAMAEAARRRRYDWLLVTDHSYSLTIARGLTRDKAIRQRQEIVWLNRRLAPFRILQGVELEIRPDGTLDFDDAFLATFDVVTASLHTGTRKSGADNTGRLLKAVRHPAVAVLNHPTGRILDQRSGYDLDLIQVIRGAIHAGTALEINGSHRMDLPEDWARIARDMGADFSLASDAHAVAQLDDMYYALALARRAWIGPERVLNTRPVTDLLANREAA